MKIFVAKLSQSTTAESLQMLMEQWGEVTSSKVIMDAQTGRSKCYGFVEMPDDEKAAQAVAELEGVEYEGSVITLKEAVPHEEYKKTHPSAVQTQKNYRPARQQRPRYNSPDGQNNGYQHREGGFRPRQNGNQHRHYQQNGQRRQFRPRNNESFDQTAE